MAQRLSREKKKEMIRQAVAIIQIGAPVTWTRETNAISSRLIK
jgi:hypothetical protein